MQLSSSFTQKAPLSSKRSTPQKLRVVGASALSCSLLLGLSSLAVASSAFAAEAKIELGTSANYSVLGGSAVTNTGNSILAQDLGVSPGTSITGFPPGIVLGTVHATDAEASLAQNNLVTAYDDTAGRAPTANVEKDITGQTLVSGVYKAAEELELSGTVTLDGQNDPNSVWIFQVGSSLTTASSSSVALVNGAQACNVYWQVGSSATLGTASDFKGNLLALTSITVTNEATVEGRVLARNGAVTLDDNTFTSPGCETSLPGDGETPPVDDGDDETPPVDDGEGETPLPPTEGGGTEDGGGAGEDGNPDGGSTPPVDGGNSSGDGGTTPVAPGTPTDAVAPAIPPAAPPVNNPGSSVDIPANDADTPVSNDRPADNSANLEVLPDRSAFNEVPNSENASMIKSTTQLADTGATGNQILASIAALLLALGVGTIAMSKQYSKRAQI